MRRWSREVAVHVAPFAAEHGGDLAGLHLLGTSGTVTTLAGLLSRSDALRPPPRRRDLDERRGTHRDDRTAARHELSRPRRQPLHRHRARRSGAGRLRHPRRDPRGVPAAAAAGRRSRPARGHAGGDDARGRRAGAPASVKASPHCARVCAKDRARSHQAASNRNSWPKTPPDGCASPSRAPAG